LSLVKMYNSKMCYLKTHHLKAHRLETHHLMTRRVAILGCPGAWTRVTPRLPLLPVCGNGNPRVSNAYWGRQGEVLSGYFVKRNMVRRSFACFEVLLLSYIWFTRLELII